MVSANRRKRIWSRVMKPNPNVNIITSRTIYKYLSKLLCPLKDKRMLNFRKDGCSLFYLKQKKELEGLSVAFKDLKNSKGCFKCLLNSWKYHVSLLPPSLPRESIIFTWWIHNKHNPEIQEKYWQMFERITLHKNMGDSLYNNIEIDFRKLFWILYCSQYRTILFLTFLFLLLKDNFTRIFK